jgi:hypothetical protein
MDMNFLMMNQISSMPQISNSEAIIPNSPAMDEGFDDLLGMVENLETAELSSSVDAELNWSEILKSMPDDAEIALGKEKNIALSNLQFQALPALQEASEMDQVNIGIVQKKFGQGDLQIAKTLENSSEIETINSNMLPTYSQAVVASDHLSTGQDLSDGLMMSIASEPSGGCARASRETSTPQSPPS